jgi:hypothetical protein
MQERSTPRESYINIKGDFTRKGGAVSPGVPAVISPLLDVAHPSRLDLARWLVDRRNPLTARVTMNRLWQQYLGRGLVETDNDFGMQGSRPTHPGLLDWLATEFMARGWSLKAMHRLIVTSATYRQSSRFRADLTRVDPDNRLLARQSRLRLDAEVIRDVALAATGLLSPKIGGPSVFPPQPDGVMTLGQMRRPWDVSAGPDRYRRGLYTFFWRATPHPALMVFDAPDSTAACTRRNRSNTPLQALTLLNDAAQFEFSQALAERVLKEVSPDDPARMRHLFRLCLAREPTTIETERLLRLLTEERAGLAAAPQDTLEVETEGVSSYPVAGQLAAWTLVARVVLNLDEFITRE